MGRRILNRKDLRADFDAAERRKTEDDETEETDETEEEDADEEGDEEDAEADAEAEPDAEAETDEDEGEGEDEAPKKKRKPAKPKAKPKAPKTTRSRSRTPKITRMKVVWGVFSNSNQRVATFDYPKRKDADDLAAKLTTDKKSTHFVQPVKEPMEEKKEE